MVRHVRARAVSEAAEHEVVSVVRGEVRLAASMALCDAPNDVVGVRW